MSIKVTELYLPFLTPEEQARAKDMPAQTRRRCIGFPA